MTDQATVDQSTAEQVFEPIRTFHGTAPPRGIASVARVGVVEGRFGKMFPDLPASEPSDDDLIALAATMIEPAPGDAAEEDNPDIAAGFTYVGQFVDHDITFDPASRLQRQNDPNALRNFRTPRYDLDSLYGSGPSDMPFMYQLG